jgi:hypothetical protein
MSRRFARRYDRDEAWPTGADAQPEAPLFTVQDHDERRILSWSPDPFEDVPEPDEADVPPPEASTQPPKAARQAAVQPDPPARVARQTGTRRRVRRVARDPNQLREVEQEAQTGPPARDSDVAGAEARGPEAPAPKRGRPRGKVARRQVHFHVDPDEELLLLAAGRTYGSQQKGLIAALEALQEAALLRDEIERLRDECERQRRLLAEAASLFKR